MDDENTHYVATKYSQRIHWKNGHACGKDDEPDRIELRPSHANWPTLDFAMPRQKLELERVERLMQAAYDRGQADAKAAMGALFRDIIAL